MWFSHCRAKTSRCSDREASQEPTDSTRHIGSAREQLGSERGWLPARNRQGSSAGKQKKVLQAPSCPHADLQRVPAKAAPVCSALPACCAERQSAPHTAPPAGGSSPAGCLAYFLGQYCTVGSYESVITRKARLQALGPIQIINSLSLHNYICSMFYVAFGFDIINSLQLYTLAIYHLHTICKRAYACQQCSVNVYIDA